MIDMEGDGWSARRRGPAEADRSFHLEKATSGPKPDRLSGKISGADPSEDILKAGKRILRTLKELMG